MRDNKLIFFPSLSSGNSQGWLQKNREIHPGLSCRFYEKDYPIELYHPYFLLSAGHRYKEMEIREKMGLQDSFVIGDSGGYQIATGALKWDTNLRTQIFNWLENNSDIAMNIDIPTRGIYANHLDDALNLSIENFKYFNENQSGKTKYLNVLQGMCESKEFGKKWYNAVKDFEFGGWAFGGAKTADSILYSVAFLLENKEFEKNHNKYLHYLGATSPTHVILFTMLQKAFNNRYGNKYQLTTDSSSPNLATIFGTYYTGVNWNTLSMNSITIGKKHKLNLEELLPCPNDCKICEGVTFQDISKFDEYQYMILTHHNMMIYKQMFDFCDKLFKCNDEIIKEFISADLYKVYQSMNEILESDNPIAIYNKYLPVYQRLNNSVENISVDNESINEFFNVVEEEKVKVTKKERREEKELKLQKSQPLSPDVVNFFNED